MRRLVVVICGLVTWGWALWTLYSVGRFGGAVVVDPSTTARIMGVRNGDQVTSAIGLTYSGVPGAVLVVVELLAVMAALGLTLTSTARPRRIGLVLLCAWALLWLGNSIWMETLTGGRHASATTLLAVAVLSVLSWTALRWRN